MLVVRIQQRVRVYVFVVTPPSFPDLFISSVSMATLYLIFQRMCCISQTTSVLVSGVLSLLTCTSLPLY